MTDITEPKAPAAPAVREVKHHGVDPLLADPNLAPLLEYLAGAKLPLKAPPSQELVNLARAKHRATAIEVVTNRQIQRGWVSRLFHKEKPWCPETTRLLGDAVYGATEPAYLALIAPPPPPKVVPRSDKSALAALRQAAKSGQKAFDFNPDVRLTESTTRDGEIYIQGVTAVLRDGVLHRIVFTPFSYDVGDIDAERDIIVDLFGVPRAL